MPKRKNLDKFPPEFWALTKLAIDLFEGKKIGGEPLVKIPCENIGQATNLMLQLRQYWNALAGKGENGEIPSYDERSDYLPNVPLLACRHSKQKRETVEIIHRSQLTTSIALAGALGVLGNVLASATTKLPAAAGTPSVPERSAGAQGAQEKILKDAGLLPGGGERG